MTLSPEQRYRVETVLNDAYVDDESTDVEIEERIGQLFAEIESAEELHHIAARFNWDCGVDYLWRVIRHPQCDAGTALLLFWLGAPGYEYSERAAIDPLPDHAENLAFLQEIQRKYVSGGFSTSKILVDPRDIFGSNEVSAYSAQGGAKLVPEVMKQASPGVPLPLEELTLE